MFYSHSYHLFTETDSPVPLWSLFIIAVLATAVISFIAILILIMRRLRYVCQFALLTNEYYTIQELNVLAVNLE